MSNKMQQSPGDTMILSSFAQDVITGLTSNPKYLSSKYFYDDEGSRIFQDIMQMPEYYLTDCELEIFENAKQEIFQSFSKNGEPFDLIELGAGDGIKTAVLLKHFLNQEAAVEYIPIDISGEALRNLTSYMKDNLPSLKIKSMAGDYFKMMEAINQFDHHKKVLLFLGSNLGNFNDEEAGLFLRKLNSAMQKDDLLFIGFDLKKNPEIILQAYNDPHGHTAAFNLNLLRRINGEMGANFNLNAFRHEEIYDAATGRAESYLISLEDQSVYFHGLHKTISFEKGESIFMEMSQKYDMDMIDALAEDSGFKLVRNFHDSRLYYVNSLWKKRT